MTKRQFFNSLRDFFKGTPCGFHELESKIAISEMELSKRKNGRLRPPNTEVWDLESVLDGTPKTRKQKEHEVGTGTSFWDELQRGERSRKRHELNGGISTTNYLSGDLA